VLSAGRPTERRHSAGVRTACDVHTRHYLQAYRSVALSGHRVWECRCPLESYCAAITRPSQRPTEHSQLIAHVLAHGTPRAFPRCRPLDGMAPRCQRLHVSEVGPSVNGTRTEEPDWGRKCTFGTPRAVPGLSGPGPRRGVAAAPSTWSLGPARSRDRCCDARGPRGRAPRRRSHTGGSRAWRSGRAGRCSAGRSP
jgi:hypothetical protein